MCGIAGQARADGQPVSPETIERMCEGIVHRGPDSRGIHCEGQVGLGIQRLRVIDLETGDQPIYNEDRTVAVVLNGEIYNFQELRKRLLANGHRLRTSGDTEVIPHLYEELGDDLVDELRGMFAFALWDSNRRRLLIARDRVGKKPLLYAHRPGALSFASEMGALVQDREVGRTVDVEALNEYLALGYTPHPTSAFQEVRKLPPGSMLKWSNGEIEIERYWRLRYSPKPAPGTQAETEEEIRHELRSAVRRRLVSDVPLGAFLSGGIDSGAVVAAMAMESSGPVKTFSIGFEDDRHSELPLARLIAERYGTDHREFVLRPEALSVLPAIVRHYGEPFADTSSVPSFQVAAMAAESVTVALNGDGGDEAFAGYHRYLAEARVARLDRLPAGLRRQIAERGKAAGGRGDSAALRNRLRRLAILSGMSQAERHKQQMSIFDGPGREDLYSDDFKARLATLEAGRAIEGSWTAASSSDALDRLLEVDFNTYLPDDLCFKIDIATMAHSLETRSPFLDQEFVEFAAKLPVDRKLNRGERKASLKAAVRPWLPAETLAAPKRGFGIPSAGEWLRDELRDFASSLLLEDRSLGRGYFRPAAVRSLLDAHISSRANNGPKLWSLMMLELWHREFVDRAPPL
jgi:asparagine synthase (glutamine-hydrolysing)